MRYIAHEVFCIKLTKGSLSLQLVEVAHIPRAGE